MMMVMMMMLIVVIRLTFQTAFGAEHLASTSIDPSTSICHFSIPQLNHHTNTRTIHSSTFLSTMLLNPSEINTPVLTSTTTILHATT